MFARKAELDRYRCELEEYRGTGLTPKQIRALKKEALALREYIEWLESL